MTPGGLLNSLQSTRLRSLASMRGLSLATRLLSARYTLAVGAQALVSGFHFVLNLVLVRQISQYDYGIFAFAFVLAMFAQAINNALISTPLTVYTPVLKDTVVRDQQEKMLSVVNLVFCAALMLIGLLYVPFSQLETTTLISISIFVSVYAARHYSRSFGYARLRPMVTATGDATYMISGMIILGTMIALNPRPHVGSILIALACANLIAIVVENLLLHGKQALDQLRGSWSDYGHIWEQSRWALAGAVTTLFMGQAHSLIIVKSHGPAAFAPLAAGAVLFGPVRVALMTWQNMVKPEMAVALSENRISEVRSQMKRTTILMAVAMLCVVIALVIMWPWINDFLYAKRYASEPMALIVALWAAITLCSASYTPLSAALQALKDFKALAMGSIYASVIAAVSVLFLLHYYAPETTLWGIVLAELFMAIFLYRVVTMALQNK